jgi:two-component system phosphate regulon sensor histidine kinase PhoR
MLQHFGNLVRDPGFAAYYGARDFLHAVIMPGRDSTSSKPVKLSVHLHPYGEGRSLVLSHDITSVEQADVMRRDFVANVSHEIRTPLTVLAGFVETMQSLPLADQERQRYLGLMSHQAQRMQTLVNDLLMLSRLEGSPLPTTHEWVSVNTLISQCEQDAHDLSSMVVNRVKVVGFEVEGLCELAGSSSELLSAMFNLIGNAIRYTPVDRAIHVSWRLLPSGGAIFSVKDSGPGIAPEHIARLTERFYRVDRSRSRDTGGTGLGLAIVKHVAQRHGAELVIDSVPGKGSTFSITFPAQRVRQPVLKQAVLA